MKNNNNLKVSKEGFNFNNPFFLLAPGTLPPRSPYTLCKLSNQKSLTSEYKIKKKRVRERKRERAIKWRLIVLSSVEAV